MSDDDKKGMSQSIAARHLVAAEYFSEQAGEMEEEFEENDQYTLSIDSPKSEDQLNHELVYESLAIYSVISSVAYLDSHIHELYHKHLEILDDEYPIPSDQFVVSDSRFVEMLGKYQEIEGDDFFYKPTLDKYQSFLVLAGKETFNSGEMPYQNIKTVIKLRNYFIHYQTEYYPQYTESEHIEHSIGSALQGKFALNPMANDRLPFFPDHCLSHGLSQWALEESKEFITEFYTKADIHPFPTPATRHIESENTE